MSTPHLIFFSVAGLRPRDVDRHNTPTLHAWAQRGALAKLTPSFPCVTSCVQASMWTGTPPGRNGVIANGFYHRDRRAVEFWVARNGIIEGAQIWEAINAVGLTSAVWHAQNIKDAAADFIVTPAPIHEPDGTTKLWCYSKPDGLYQQLLDDLGHFPLQRYWGPLAGLDSTRWILSAALWLIERHAPNFHWIYIPHPDYAAQKYGPDSEQSKAALAELDMALAAFAEQVAQTKIGKDVVYLVAGEYAMTDVSGVLYPNRILRNAGLLNVREEDGCEHVDLPASAAFAMVDHQFAHVYVNPEAMEETASGRSRPEQLIARVQDLFRNVSGIAGVYAGEARREVGLDHPRSGEIVLVAEDDHWFAYSWWLDAAAAPPFARTVDIHSKPGYDPCEMFIDPATKSISLDPRLVKGSHGVPASESRHRAALICSAPSPAVSDGKVYRDTDVKGMALSLLGL